jgi:hypothetical protein
VEDVDEAEDNVSYGYAITSYGADYPVDGLVKRIDDDSILIPEFQRKFVWNRSQASRFIESLLLGLPVPGVFFEKEQGQQKLLIIDGQQRLLSLYYFYTGIFGDSGREFTLTCVLEPFEGKSYKTLADSDQRRLDDAIIHATVVRQDEPTDDRGSIYQVFERLNTGGSQLTAQEIRTCVYHGGFCDLIKDLNSNSLWRGIFGPESRRMKDQELILRFFALLHARDEYSRPMKGFLNKFMGHHRHLDVGIQAQRFEDEFISAVELIHETIGKKAFRPASTLNAAVFDGVMVGIATRMRKGSIAQKDKVQERYDHLLQLADFQAAYKKSTADEAQVERRIAMGIAAFQDLK